MHSPATCPPPRGKAVPWFRVHSWPGAARFALALVLACAGLGTGCRLVRGVADVPGQAVRAVTPGQKDKNAVDPVEVQQKLLRLADEFSAQMAGGIDKLRQGMNAIAPAEALKWKVILVTESCAIASGPNALANLLDMTVFVTATRAAVEDHWQPKVFGASAQPLLDMCRTSETNIWGLAGSVLKPEQLEELRRAIAEWHRQHPVPEMVMGARGVGFAMVVGRVKKPDTAAPDSVFGLLGLDPLSGLDPATREIALARMFAERALHVTQWMPTLLRWQIELMSLHAMAMPEVQQMITNSTQLAASVERFAGVAEQLPKQVSAEREEILKALQSQEKGLAALAGEFRQTLNAGAQMSTSLNTTLTTFDAVMKRFGVGDTNNTAPPATNAEPFRIQDYTATAAQLEATARQLTELLRTLDQTIGSTNLAQLSAQVGPAVQLAESGCKAVVAYAFWRGVLLVAIVLVAALFIAFSPRGWRAPLLSIRHDQTFPSLSVAGPSLSGPPGRDVLRLPAFEHAAAENRPGRVRIHSGREKPADAFAVVPYRGHWFWIDDGDWRPGVPAPPSCFSSRSQRPAEVKSCL